MFISTMLHVGHLNVYHLDGKIPDVHNFLNKASPPFHLYGFTETRLRGDIPDSQITIPDYEIIRRDANRPGETGIAAYVHSSISQYTHRRQDFEHASIECLWLEFKHNTSSPSVYVCFLYRNPSATVEWLEHFSEMLDNIYKCKTQADILLLGDFNIDLSVPQSRWTTLIKSAGLTQHISQPTRVTNKSSTVIDHIYSNNPQCITAASISDLSISDHSPIYCFKTTKMPQVRSGVHNVISFRSFKNFDINLFLFDLSQADFQSVYNFSDPEEALNSWYNVFLGVVNQHAPVRKKRVKNASLPPWLTNEIIQAMAQRDHLKKSKQFDEYKKVRNRVKNLVRDSKKDLFCKLVENNKNTAQIWRALNALSKGSSNKTRGSVPKTLTADALNSHFLSIPTGIAAQQNFSNNADAITDELRQHCSQANEGKRPFKIPPIGIHEVGKHISKLDNKKSSGLDGISNYLLKLSLPYVVESLTYIFNLCLENNFFPTAFKMAKVIPLPKSQNTSDINNFRPISLLPVLSKILEKHVHLYLTSHLERLSLIHPLQSGFRSNHSCSTALSLLTNNWLAAINNSKISGAVFLDLAKAFDLVNHNILLQKLNVYLANSEAIPFFKSYLDNRSQRVYIHGSLSYKGDVTHGVPQGSVLGPILFCIYINDLPMHILDKSVQCHLLADDTTIEVQGTLSTVQTSLQSALADIDQWCGRNHMVLNPLKTKSMLISTRQKHQLSTNTLTLKLSDSNIEQVNEHKLLGVVIDNSLRWNAHIDSLCKRVSKNLFLLSKLQSVISLEARKLFYYAHIKSHIDYASFLWDGCSEALFKNINSLHRRAAKLILPNTSMSPESKMETLGMLPLKKHLQLNKAVFMHKIIHGNAPVYLKQLFREAPSRYSVFKRNLACPKPRVDIYKTSVAYSGAFVWNALPLHHKSIFKLSSFRSHTTKLLRAQCKL
jgi:hypothetical protein